MKTARFIIAVVIVLAFVLGGCADKAGEAPSITPEENDTPNITDTPSPAPKELNTPTLTPEDEINPQITPAAEVTGIISFKLLSPEKIADNAKQKITASAEEAGAVAEYWVSCSIAKFGVYSFELQVFENGSGAFKYIIERQGMKKETLLNEVRDIDKEDTDILLLAISDNDFWNIPTVHPDEAMGDDGSDINVAGYSDGSAHYISMWQPGREYGIYKIFQAFYDYSKNIAEDPLGLINRDVLCS